MTFGGDESTRNEEDQPEGVLRELGSFANLGVIGSHGIRLRFLTRHVWMCEFEDHERRRRSRVGFLRRADWLSQRWNEL